jgi:hypothetical protein
MIVGFALAVVGHGRHPGAGDSDEGDKYLTARGEAGLPTESSIGAAMKRRMG